MAKHLIAPEINGGTHFLLPKVHADRVERGVRVSVDLHGEPLALWQSITQMARCGSLVPIIGDGSFIVRDEESYLCVMGKDALDVFLPYLIDMQLRVRTNVCDAT